MIGHDGPISDRERDQLSPHLLPPPKAPNGPGRHFFRQDASVASSASPSPLSLIPRLFRPSPSFYLSNRSLSLLKDNSWPTTNVDKGSSFFAARAGEREPGDAEMRGAGFIHRETPPLPMGEAREDGRREMMLIRRLRRVLTAILGSLRFRSSPLS